MKKRLYSLLAIMLLVCVSVPVYASYDRPDRAFEREEEGAAERLYQLLEEGFRNAVGLHDDSYIDISEFRYTADSWEDYKNSDFYALMLETYVRVQYDHPEYFYITGAWSSKWDGNQLVGIVAEYYDFAREPGVIEAFQKGVDEILEQAEGIEEPLELLLFLHDYLDTHNVYNWYVSTGQEDKAPPSAWTAYSAIVEGDTVCRGYALAYQVLLDRRGIKCHTIGSSKMNHVWNMVELDGEWYHVDVNNDNYAIRGRCQHTRFLCSDEAMVNLGYHDWGYWLTAMPDAVPVCDSHKYDAGWCFHGVEFPLYRWKGNYYSIRAENGAYRLCRGSISEAGTEQAIIPLNTHYEENRGYVRSGILWNDGRLFYVNENKELVCYALENGQSRVWGEILFTAEPSPDGYYGAAVDGMGLYYDKKYGELVVESRTRRTDLARFSLDASGGEAVSAALTYGRGDMIRVLDPQGRLAEGTVVFAAGYSKDGKMTDIACARLERDGVVYRAVYPKNVNASARIFFLDPAAYEPLCGAVELKMAMQ